MSYLESLLYFEPKIYELDSIEREDILIYNENYEILLPNVFLFIYFFFLKKLKFINIKKKKYLYICFKGN